MRCWWVDGTTATAVQLLQIVSVVIHGRFVGWVRYVGGWWIDGSVGCTESTSPDREWMSGLGLGHGVWVGEYVGRIPAPMACKLTTINHAVPASLFIGWTLVFVGGDPPSPPQRQQQQQPTAAASS